MKLSAVLLCAAAAAVAAKGGPNGHAHDHSRICKKNGAKKDKVELDCTTVVEDVRDRLHFEIKTEKKGGVTFKVKYDFHNKSDVHTRSATKFEVAYTHMIEFTPNGTSFAYDRDLDDTEQVLELGEFSEIVATEFDGADRYTMTTKDGVFAVVATINASVAEASVGRLSADFFKIDFTVTNFAFVGAANTTSLALLSEVKSDTKIHQHKRKGKDPKDSKGKASRSEFMELDFGATGSTRLGQPMGLFSWDDFVAADGTEVPVVVSETSDVAPPDAGKGKKKKPPAARHLDKERQLVFAFATTKHAELFAWDPEIGVAYEASDGDGNDASVLGAGAALAATCLTALTLAR